MSQVAESILTHRRRVAAVAAGGVAGVLVVQDLFSTVNFLLIGYAQAEYNTGNYLGHLWQSVGYGYLLILAFVIGVGISLWRLVPVTAEIKPTTVVMRGLIAAGVGAILIFLVHLAIGLIGPMSGTGSLFGNSFPELPWGDIGQAASLAFNAGFELFLRQAPVVVLVVLLVWIWLAKRPSRHAVSADSGEV